MARYRRRKRLPSTIRVPRYYRRHPLFVAVVLIIGFVAFLGRDAQRSPSAPVTGSDLDRYDGQTFTVVHVADGDTVDVDAPDGNETKTRIRLWGVDTPETDKSPTGRMFYGDEASDFTRSALLGRRVRLLLVADDTRDKYNRLLAYIVPVDTGRLFNEILVEAGYAYADPRFKHPHRERFLSLESNARAARVGLWQSVTPDQMPNWRRRNAAK
ncbi:MAG: hypothetical protein HOP29_18560 [Phycisphaerales bacterium]|nr:hypothetical protein [Phycisphaerales bacterium]